LVSNASTINSSYILILIKQQQYQL
jgi:hypothetical protein